VNGHFCGCRWVEISGKNIWAASEIYHLDFLCSVTFLFYRLKFTFLRLVIDLPLGYVEHCVAWTSLYIYYTLMIVYVSLPNFLFPSLFSVFSMNLSVSGSLLMQSVFYWIQSELVALRRVVWIGLLDKLSYPCAILFFSLFVFLNSLQIICVKEIFSLFFIQVRRDQIAIPVENK